MASNKQALLKPAGSVEWYTPRKLVRELEQRFCPNGFTLDPCAPNGAVSKAPLCFTPVDDGLSKNWSGHRVFMNPPYGREMPLWLSKAYSEARQGAYVVGLLPARTDTKAWHEFIEEPRLRGEVEVYFMRGRVRFGTPTDPDGEHTDPAPFPTAIVVWGLNKAY